MSDPIDIKALDEYLKGGSDISQRYRELGREDVPPELDRRVLEEARAAVAGGGAARSRSWLRWSAPVALAASVVLVVAVVIESPVQDETIAIQPASEARQAEEYKLQEEPEALAASGCSGSGAATGECCQGRDEARGQRSGRRGSFGERGSVARVVVRKRAGRCRLGGYRFSRGAARGRAAGACDAHPIHLGPKRSRSRGRAGRFVGQGKRLSRVAGSRGHRHAAAAQRRAYCRPTQHDLGLCIQLREAADCRRRCRRGAADPAKWLEEIRDLRRAGKTAEADRAWERFREAFPDFAVAEDDIARKKP